ncbi:MAG: hypothetical protein M1820_010134 [Bogoriella megaspora]|nr:MAG: hypothetical protein M1820_010134 [Bogoriella megaspora]
MNDPSSPRAIQAISRMNFLHGRYHKAGKILNSDMLYTLSVFALEPVRWINKYEWRTLTDIERCASGTYWKAMGDAMEIDMSVLPSCSSGWKDGLQWLEEVETWSLVYEEQHMTSSENNARLANANLDVIFFNLPSSMKIIAKNAVSAIVGERLRRAMILPEPCNFTHRAVHAVLMIRRFILLYCCLPRPNFFRKERLSRKPDSQTGHYNAIEYLSYPWYVKPTWLRRWGPWAFVLRAIGRKVPGDDGNRYAPEGYRLEEVGPESQKGKGGPEMERTALRLQHRKGCPFTSQ